MKPDRNNDTVLDLTIRKQLCFLPNQPDLQHISNPSALGDPGSALCFISRIQTTLKSFNFLLPFPVMYPGIYYFFWFEKPK